MFINKGVDNALETLLVLQASVGYRNRLPSNRWPVYAAVIHKVHFKHCFTYLSVSGNNQY